MIQRFKIEKYYPVVGGTEFYYQEVPIREWSLSPNLIFEVWVLGTNIPTSRAASVVFPEIENIKEYSNITSFRYALETTNVLSNCYDIISLHDLNNISLTDKGVHLFEIKFKNFNELNIGTNLIPVKHVVYGTDENGNEVELESRIQEIRLIRKSNVSDNYINVNNGVFNIYYDKDTNEFFGDNILSVSKGLNELFSVFEFDINLPDSVSDKLFFQRTRTQLGFENSYIINKISNATLVDEVYEFDVTIKLTEYKESLISPKKFDEFNLYDPIDFSYLNDPIIVQDKVKIVLKVIDKQFNFNLTKSLFTGVLKTHENNKYSEQVEILNFDNSNLTLETSEWITATIENDILSFETLNATSLKIGKNYGFILVSSETTTRVITIIVDVIESIVSEFEEINFCLDNLKIEYQKQNEASQFLRANIIMKFEGYGKPAEVITETYEYVFFNDKVVLYPGEEVQDFFNEIESIETIKINESTGDIPKANELFKTCLTSIELEEYDNTGEVYLTSKLDDIYFLPGKKPKGYPYLTNGVVRKTYKNSLISVSAIKSVFENKRLGEVAGNLIDNSNLTNDKTVVNISFRRSIADRTYGELNVIEKESLSLNPIPETENVIDVIFQNQNLCPDWFSFVGEWQLHPELNHVISENIKNGKDFKSSVEKKSIIKLNTGWLFKEEIDLLSELIEAKVCFANINGEWIKLIPLTKKPLPFYSQKSLNSQIVEFKKVDDER